MAQVVFTRRRPQSGKLVFTCGEWIKMIACLRERPVAMDETGEAVGERLADAIGRREVRLCLSVVLQIMHAVGQEFWFSPVNLSEPT